MRSRVRDQNNYLFFINLYAYGKALSETYFRDVLFEQPFERQLL